MNGMFVNGMFGFDTSEMIDTPFGKMPKQKKSKKGRTGVYSDAVEIFDQMNKYVYADELFRKEYTALRSLMNKRIKRAKQAGYLENMGYFPKLKDIPHRQAFAVALAQARQAYENPLTTARGRQAREETAIESLHERGFEGINRKNYKLFQSFMRKMRERYVIDTPDGKKTMFSSDRAVEAFEEISERFTPKTNVSTMMRYFNEWLDAGGAI